MKTRRRPRRDYNRRRAMQKRFRNWLFGELMRDCLSWRERGEIITTGRGMPPAGARWLISVNHGIKPATSFYLADSRFVGKATTVDADIYYQRPLAAASRLCTTESEPAHEDASPAAPRLQPPPGQAAESP